MAGEDARAELAQMDGMAMRLKARAVRLGNEALERYPWLYNAPELLFYPACVMWLVYAMVSKSSIDPVLVELGITRDFAIHRVVLLLAASELIRIWRREYGPRDAVAFIVFAVMSLCSWRCGMPTIVCANAVVLCARHLPMRRVVGVGATVVGVVFSVMAVTSLLGIIPDYVVVQGSRVRHCLGYTYPLFPAMYLFTVTCVVCWLRGKKLSIWEAALLVAANIAIYELTRSRLTVGLSIICVVVTLLYRSRIVPARVGYPVLKVASWAFPLAVVVTLVLTSFYGIMGGEGVAHTLDKLLGSRLRLGYSGVVNLGVTLFGQRVPWIGTGLSANGEGVQVPEGYNWVDNLFLHAAIESGIVYTVCLVVLYTLVARRAYHEGDVMLVMVLSLLALCATMDDMALNLQYNVLMFLVASIGNPKALEKRPFRLKRRSP